jgi:hypothetical protein
VNKQYYLLGVTEWVDAVFISTGLFSGQEHYLERRITHYRNLLLIAG